MSKPDHRLGWTLTAIAGVVVFVAFTIWGGIPTETKVGLFWLQASLFLPGHLRLRPGFLASARPSPGNRTCANHRMYGFVVSREREIARADLWRAAAYAIFVGGVWDEIWHRSYGIPFGEDLFWRPHLAHVFWLHNRDCAPASGRCSISIAICAATFSNASAPTRMSRVCLYLNAAFSALRLCQPTPSGTGHSAKTSPPGAFRI